MKNVILNILKNANDYISGETISKKIGISRAAVWKNINKLKNEGYIIDSVTNKGYKIVQNPDLVTEAEIKDGLNTKIIGNTIKYYTETDSTNNEAKNHNQNPDGTVFITEKQLLGKGRLGRNWISPSGVGIWMSLLLKPNLLPTEVSKLTLLAGLAICRALKKNNITANIKWPNDIVLNSKKICGILTEMSAEIEKVNYIVCGIGINVNTTKFDDDLSTKATSLFIETGIKQNRKLLIQNILHEFEILYIDFLENGISNMLYEYKKNCITLNREVNVIYKDKSILAKAIDIDEGGCLVIEYNNEILTVSSGEVSVRGIYGYI